MARLLFAFLLVAMAVIQATLLPRLNPIGAAPDVVLILLFVWSTVRGTKEALAWVFVTGLMLDVLALDTFGVNGLALAPVVLLAGPTREPKLHTNILVPIVLVVIATALHAILLGLLRGTLMLSPVILFQMAMHIGITAIIYLILRVVDR